MKDIEFKILDILSREIGNPISIRKLKEKINDVYGHAHYPMIYNTIQQMAESKLVHIDKYGKSSVASLKFANPLLIDNLAQVEIINKIRFLEERKDWQILVLQINGYLRDFNMIKSILMIKPETNAKLNRIELLILLRNKDDSINKELDDISDIVELLQRVHNIRIDHLTLDESSFKSLLRSDDANQIKEILFDKIVIFYPQSFWFLIKNMFDEGIRLQVEEKPINPGKISEQDVEYNLNRFGYQEFGTKISIGNNIGIEYITTSILLKGDARKKEAIPIILAKNSDNTNYDLLVFLSKKYRTEGLITLLKLVYEAKPSNRLKQGIMALKDYSIGEREIDADSIRKKMILYNVK
jgi:hypothetical protein